MKVITMKMPRDFSGNIGREIWNFFIITIGCAAAGLGLSLFVIPNRIAPGGITGLATIIYHWIGWPVGITALALNIPLFLMSLRIIGSAFCIRTIMATFLLSLFIDLFAGITPITDDLLLAVIAGGGMMGLGYGLVFRRNATTGGTKEVLVCVLTARQVPSLRRIVKDTDPGAFVYISETREVFGQGFQPHN